MAIPETFAVLRDVLVVALIALAVAMAVYEFARRSFDVSWNLEGNVLTRPYGLSEGAVAFLLLAYLCAGFFRSVDGVADASATPVTVGSLLLTVVQMLLICLVVLSHLVVVRGLNPAELFGLRQMPLKRVLRYAVIALILTAVGGALVMQALITWNGGELPDATPQNTIEAFENGGSVTYRVLLAFMAIVTAPLFEEFLFRGFLYGVVKRATDRWFAAVFSAVIFAVVHIHVGSAPPLFLLGLGLAIAYEQSGCLLVPIFMHAIFNAWNISVLIYTAYTT